MKKKIFIGIVMSLFAVATVFNLSISKQSKAGDVSLEAVAVMAKAQYAENPINKGYGALDIPCYDSRGIPTGESRRSCFSGGVLESCTPHGCQ